MCVFGKWVLAAGNFLVV